MWQPIITAPINKSILLWNNDLQEISIGHKPEDAPHDDCVVILMTACHADAWHPLPEPPEASDDEDSE